MKVLCVLYDDPKGGMPKATPVAKLPKLDKYPDGMALPTPKGIDQARPITRMCFGGIRFKKVFRV